MLIDLSGFDLPRRDSLALDQTARLRMRRGGELRVEAGQVWLTRDGQLDDHVLGSGDHIHLAAGDRAVAEPWHPGSPARLSWRADDQRPRRRGGWRWGLGGVVLAVVLFVDLFASRLPAWARSADASANLAQGPIACAESIASSGALQ